MRKWFYTKPQYAKFEETTIHTPLKHIIMRILGSLVMLKLGYEIGMVEAKDQTQQYNDNKVVPFESEEQIFDYLYNKNKMAVFLQFYVPGYSSHHRFMRTFEKASSDSRYNDIVFMSVHCRKNLTFCLNKAFDGRIEPYAELYYINETD